MNCLIGTFIFLFAIVYLLMPVLESIGDFLSPVLESIGDFLSNDVVVVVVASIQVVFAVVCVGYVLRATYYLISGKSAKKSKGELLREKEAAEKEAKKEKEAAEREAEKEKKLEAARELLRKKATEIIEKHATTLGMRRSQLISKDIYGNLNLEKWISEKEYFRERTIRPAIKQHAEHECRTSSIDLYDILNDVMNEISSLIECIIVDAFAEDEEFREDMSGEEYEAFCSKKLREHGWETTQTMASNDQGVDIIAEKDDIRLCIQCKRYSSPVGNKAVQEIVAGMGFYKGNRSSVISNAGFTQQAESLARSNNVLLLSHSQISGLDDLIAGSAV